MTQRTWDADALDAMAPSVAASPWAGLDDARDVLHGAHLFDYRDEHGAHVLLALRGVTCAHGRVLDVVGMRSMGNRFRPDALGPALEDLAQRAYGGVDLLAMTTRHRHLVRACERHGWASVATVVTKRTNLQ